MITEKDGHIMCVIFVEKNIGVTIIMDLINQKSRSDRKGSIRVTSSQGILQNVSVAQRLV